MLSSVSIRKRIVRRMMMGPDSQSSAPVRSETPLAATASATSSEATPSVPLWMARRYSILRPIGRPDQSAARFRSVSSDRSIWNDEVAS